MNYFLSDKHWHILLVITDRVFEFDIFKWFFLSKLVPFSVWYKLKMWIFSPIIDLTYWLDTLSQADE